MKNSFFLFIFVLTALFSNAQGYRWAKKYGGSQTDFAQEITVTTDGEVYTAGRFQNSFTLVTAEGSASYISSGSFDIMITKNDENGNFLWARKLGSSGNDQVGGIHLDAAGNCYVVGSFINTMDADPGVGIQTLTSSGGLDIFILKLNPSGQFQWVKQIGGTGNDNPNAIDIDNSGNIAITGTFESTVDFDSGASTAYLTSLGGQDIFACKLNSTGDYLWANSIGNAQSIENANTIEFDTNGNLVIAGSFYGTVDFDPGVGTNPITATGITENYLLKLNSNGEFVFAKNIKGASISSSSVSGSATIDPNNMIYLSGEFQYSNDFDPSVSNFSMNCSGLDVFVSKYDSNGNFIWAKQFSSSSDSKMYDITLDDDQNLYVAGFFNNTVDFDPGSGTALKTSIGQRDGYITKLDLNGELEWVHTFGSTGSDHGFSITSDQAENLYYAGNFFNTVDFNPGLGVNNLVSSGLGDAVILKLGYCEPDTTTMVVEACESFTWINGTTYTSSNNTATYLMSNVGGCDSLIKLNLTIYQNTTHTDVITACNSYTWINGITYTASNTTATHNLSTIHGCDSLVTLNLTLNHSNLSTDIQTSCGPFTWINGVTYYTNETAATIHLTTVNGCDSIVTLNLTVHQPDVVVQTISACGSYTWIDGITYSSSNNTATHLLTNVSGCDSLIKLDLTIRPISYGTDVVTSCGPYTWINCVTYTSSTNTATHTLTNAAGCDSIVTLQLTILPISYGTDVVNSCGPYTWIDGVTYSSSNFTATHTLTNTAGCDSIVTLNLTIHQPDIVVQTISTCDSYTWIDGVTYSSSNNTATHLLTNISGCDSIIKLDLTIRPISYGTDVVTSCGPYTWINCVTYTSSTNTATHTLTNAAGCDSIVTLQLTILPISYGTDVVNSCGPYTWIDGVTYNSSNFTATHTLTNTVGCDSIVTLNLTVQPTAIVQHVVESCGPYTWINGTTYTSSTATPVYHLTTTSGCDSTIKLQLTIHEIDPTVTSNDNTLTANETGANYQWIDCLNGGAILPGETSQSFTATQDGSYAVRITKANCTEISDCITVSSAQINESNFPSVTVYPNPVFDILTIETTASIENIEVYSASGQLIQIVTNSSFSTVNFATGTYYLKIKTSVGTVVREFIKS